LKGLKIAVTHRKFLEQKVPEEREYECEGDLNNTPWVGIPRCKRRKRRATEEKKFLR